MDFKCSTCGERVKSLLLHTDAFGFNPFWVCPGCGHYNRVEVKYRFVGEREAEKIIANRRPFGNFVLDTGLEFIGIDNRVGNAWIEEFPTLEECLKWLI